MKANALKKKIAEGVRCVGGWAAIPDPFACEVYAAQGWDSVTIDMQHGAGNINDAVPLLAAIQSGGDATPLIRVPWNDPGQIMRALDAGAMGIICPMINTKAEAEALVRCGPLPAHGRAQLRALSRVAIRRATTGRRPTRKSCCSPWSRRARP